MRDVHLILLCSLASASTEWMPFQRIGSFDGEVCEGTEVAFSKENLKDETICLIECKTYLTCESIFYVPHSGTCIGCTLVYDYVTKPTGAAGGSIYYGHATGCAEDWFKIQESCYFITGDMSFEEGVKICHSLNAHPVVMETENENTSLKSKLRLITAAEPVVIFFTAYTDAVIDGTWAVNGTTETLAINDWGPNEPNGGAGENCLGFFAPYDFQWIDIPCYRAFRTICEKETLS